MVPGNRTAFVRFDRKEFCEDESRGFSGDNTLLRIESPRIQLRRMFAARLRFNFFVRSLRLLGQGLLSVLSWDDYSTIEGCGSKF